MRRPQAPVAVVSLALAVALPLCVCTAQQAQPAPAPAAPAAAAPAPAAAPAQPAAEGDTADLAATIQQFKAMGMDDQTATLMAMMTAGDDSDTSSMLPLLLLMAQQGGGNRGDIMGMLFFSQMMRGAQSSQAPTAVQLPDGVVLVIDRGVAYKIDTNTMKVLGQVSYRKRPKLNLSSLMMAPMMNEARDKAQQAACLSNVKQICLAMLMYTQDHDEVLPGQTWADDLQPYIKNPQVMVCPSRPETKVGYAFNKALLKANLANIAAPAETLMVFEVKGTGANPVGTADDVPPEGVHDGGICVGFADGHAKWIPVNEARELLKQPIK
jgi:hypothetical protein